MVQKFDISGVESLGMTLMGQGGAINALGIAAQPQASQSPAPAPSVALASTPSVGA